MKPFAPKLLTHVGLTYDYSNEREELRKAQTAINAGASIIADVSLGKKTFKFLKMLCENISAPVTALPGYILATQNGGNTLPRTISKNQILDTTEKALLMGIKGFTVHSAFRKKHLVMLQKTKRVFPFTSRMGNYIREYMIETQRENPFYLYFADIVALAKKHNATISIGTALRSPSVANEGGFDELHKREIQESSELINLCNKNDVNVMLEGVGHIALNRMKAWYLYSKKTCDGVPLRALPMITDRGMGHDHITGAIATAFLAQIGVEVICTMTRAEHVGHPTIDEIKESVIASRIAIESVFPIMEYEKQVAVGRNKGGCHYSKIFKYLIDGPGALKLVKEKIARYGYEDGLSPDEVECGMCGISCPLKKRFKN